MRPFCLLLLLQTLYRPPRSRPTASRSTRSWRRPSRPSSWPASSGARFAWSQSVEGVRNVCIRGRARLRRPPDHQLHRGRRPGSDRVDVYRRRQVRRVHPRRRCEPAGRLAEPDADARWRGAGRAGRSDRRRRRAAAARVRRPSSPRSGRRARRLGEPRAALDDRPRGRRREGDPALRRARRRAADRLGAGRRLDRIRSAAAARTASSACSLLRAGAAIHRSVARSRQPHCLVAGQHARRLHQAVRGAAPRDVLAASRRGRAVGDSRRGREDWRGA